MKRNFSSFIEFFKHYTTNVGAPEKFLTWSAISGVAACLERKTWVLYNNVTPVYPNLYVMLIAESGIANKTTATKPIIDLLKDVPDVRQMSTQMSSAALVRQLKDAGDAKIITVEGKKYPNSSLFTYSSEAASTIGESRALGDIQVLLTDFYDCGDIAGWSDSHGWTKSLIGTGTQTILNPCLNLLYCSTPTWLLKCIGKNGIEGGFASRVLFVNQFERSNGSQEWMDEEDMKLNTDPEFKKKLVEDLKQISKMTGKFSIAKGFKDAYNRILKDRNNMLDNGPKEMKAYYSRKMWHTLKLAQVLTADKSNEMIIYPETLEKAEAYLRSLEAEMYKPFGLERQDTAGGFVKTLWNVIKKRGAGARIPKQEFYKALFERASARQMDEAISTLVTMKKIKPDMSQFPISYIVIDATELG